ncbi:four helix bundle protein [Candidatus Zixiibacteriota bacterium]
MLRVSPVARPKEFKRFCHLAPGSCAELETQLIIAYRQVYISKSELADIEEHLDHESRMLMKLIRSL